MPNVLRALSNRTALRELPLFVAPPSSTVPWLPYRLEVELPPDLPVPMSTRLPVNSITANVQPLPSPPSDQAFRIPVNHWPPLPVDLYDWAWTPVDRSALETLSVGYCTFSCYHDPDQSASLLGLWRQLNQRFKKLQSRSPSSAVGISVRRRILRPVGRPSLCSWHAIMGARLLLYCWLPTNSYGMQWMALLVDPLRRSKRCLAPTLWAQNGYAVYTYGRAVGLRLPLNLYVVAPSSFYPWRK